MTAAPRGLLQMEIAMHAIRLHAFGPAENLTYEQTENPRPAPGQVRIKVEAAGVHVIDTTFRSGDPKAPYDLPELPTMPGREVAGTVDGLGDGVDPSWLGRRVVAHLGLAATPNSPWSRPRSCTRSPTTCPSTTPSP